MTLIAKLIYLLFVNMPFSKKKHTSREIVIPPDIVRDINVHTS